VEDADESCLLTGPAVTDGDGVLVRDEDERASSTRLELRCSENTRLLAPSVNFRMPSRALSTLEFCQLRISTRFFIACWTSGNSLAALIVIQSTAYCVWYEPNIVNAIYTALNAARFSFSLYRCIHSVHKN
jgi:hypothetical protein